MNLDRADWGELQTFLAVARAKTLLGASRLRGVSISTVHRQLGQLEEHLGAKLLTRRGRSSALTPAGEALARRVERMDEEAQGVLREVAGIDERPRGPVRVTTTDTFAVGLLSDYLPLVRTELAEVSLTVFLDNRHFRLGHGEAEVALRPGKKPREPDVIAKKVADLAYGIYAADTYLAAHGAPRRKSQLMRHDFVAPDESLAKVVFARRTRELGDPSRVVFRSPSILMLAEAVAAGVAVGVLPCFLMDRAPGVTRLFDVESEGPLYLVHHVDHRRTARVRAVVEFLEARIAQDRDLLEGARPRGPTSHNARQRGR